MSQLVKLYRRVATVDIREAVGNVDGYLILVVHPHSCVIFRCKYNRSSSIRYYKVAANIVTLDIQLSAAELAYGLILEDGTVKLVETRKFHQYTGRLVAPDNRTVDVPGGVALDIS